MAEVIVGFKVLPKDVDIDLDKLEEKGIVFTGPIHGGRPGGSSWSHFRGPDGNIYEIKQRKL